MLSHHALIVYPAPLAKITRPEARGYTEGGYLVLADRGRPAAGRSPW
jgi:hypothetical protein